MKDPLLQKFINSAKFKRLTPQQRVVELQDYAYQTKIFNQEREKTK